ncbi:hypothetical protein BDV12DRAFT_209200 [Aspergillus spectabilis]
MTELTNYACDAFDRTAFESPLNRRLFYTESFEVYRSSGSLPGDSSGLYDYGPPGCALLSNVLDLWRRHFVVQEDMLELDCSILTPEKVLLTNRYVDEFGDWMCKDSVKGQFLRADHLIENALEGRLKGDKAVRGLATGEKRDNGGEVENLKVAKLDDAGVEKYEEILAKLGDLIKKYKIRNLDGNTPVSPPFLFNLMFSTTLGPEFYPFASPRWEKPFATRYLHASGPLDIREFVLAEIEHFVDPGGGKKHLSLSLVKGLKPSFLNRSTQLAGGWNLEYNSLADTVTSNMFNDETLGYFMGQKIRFKQNTTDEMAHYATDCWDAELQTSYGWIECIGCRDRSAYNLTVHSKKTAESLLLFESREGNLFEVDEWQIDIDKGKLGPTFKNNAKAGVMTTKVPKIGKTEVADALISIVKRIRIENIREYIPNVIEPSFVIGRVFYCLLEHVYWHRANDPARGELSLPISVAPTKVLILALTISETFRTEGLSCRSYTSSASIGKQYALNYEIGIPLGITIDIDFCEGWNDYFTRKRIEDVFARFPEFVGQSGDE